ncbi:MAG: hypothetical protein WCE94_12165 [Candidatus Methanoperedens sp.]
MVNDTTTVTDITTPAVTAADLELLKQQLIELRKQGMAEAQQNLPPIPQPVIINVESGRSAIVIKSGGVTHSEGHSIVAKPYIPPRVAIESEERRQKGQHVIR